MAQRPIVMTEDELRGILTTALARMLSRNITAKALGRPYMMTAEDVKVDANLFEQLSTACEAVHALYPQLGRHPGFTTDRTED